MSLNKDVILDKDVMNVVLSHLDSPFDIMSVALGSRRYYRIFAEHPTVLEWSSLRLWEFFQKVVDRGVQDQRLLEVSRQRLLDLVSGNFIASAQKNS